MKYGVCAKQGRRPGNAAGVGAKLKTESGAVMARKSEYSTIESVTVNYIGTDEEFNLFLKNIVRDYLQNERIEAEDEVHEKPV